MFSAYAIVLPDVSAMWGCNSLECNTLIVLSRDYAGHEDMKGGEAERYAETFLLHQHLRLLERNYRCRFGEIDLIMRDGEMLVFVEVRLRTSFVFGGAAASITSFKQAKLLRTARHYLAGLKAVPPCRFDAVLLSGSNGGKIEWIKNAFDE